MQFDQALLEAHDKIGEKYGPREGTSKSFGIHTPTTVSPTAADPPAPWEEIRPAGSILKSNKSKPSSSRGEAEARARTERWERSERERSNVTETNMSVDSEDSNVQYAQPIRIISLRKSPSQPLV